MSNIEEKLQSNFDSALFGLTLGRNGAVPLHQQLADALRQLILTGRAAPGSVLPPSRAIARELSVSRMTVTTAYDQLAAEGYLITRRGAGTYVARNLPHLSPPRRRAPQNDPPPQPRPFRPFQPGIPDSTMFPHTQWARCLDRAWRRPDPALLARPDPLGWAPLRMAIADHLSAWRGIECPAGRVIITSGAADAFGLIARALMNPGDRVLIEDPGYAPLRSTLHGAGMRTEPHRVDDAGFDIATVQNPAARAAVVTASRHYPGGATMPLNRRLALLDWASRSDAVIVEDDYDSEFRYQGQPLPALTGLDRDERVIYLGSFSKLLSPSLRLGYLVVPPSHLPAFNRVLEQTGPRASLVPQPALALFMEQGRFATHLRRMRRVYAHRQEVLRQAMSGAGHLLRADPDPAGMHLCCPLGHALAGQVSDREVAAMAEHSGLFVRALSAHSVLPDPPQGLLLGYAGYDDVALRTAAARLLELLQDCAPDHSAAGDTPVTPPGRPAAPGPGARD